MASRFITTCRLFQTTVLPSQGRQILCSSTEPYSVCPAARKWLSCNGNRIELVSYSSLAQCAHHRCDYRDGGSGGIQSRPRPSVMCRRGMAGHSKWNNIRHIKSANDSVVSAKRTSLAGKIKAAVIEKGPDPKLNLELAKLLKQGDMENVPKKTLQTMIQHGVKSSTEAALFEVLGPQGSLFLVEMSTDSVQQARYSLQSAVKKTQGTVSMSGLAKHVFEEKGVVTVSVDPEEQPLDMDKYVELAIESGAEDVILLQDDNGDPELKFHCDSKTIQSVQTALEDNDLMVTSSGIEYTPMSWVTLDGAQLEKADQIRNKIQTIPEVVRIMDNVHVPEE